MAWFVVTMGGASGNTSWEHHPYAGPFIMLKEAATLGHFVFAAFLMACVMVPLLCWIWTGRLWGLVVSILASVVTVKMSYTFAAWASC